MVRKRNKGKSVAVVEEKNAPEEPMSPAAGTSSVLPDKALRRSARVVQQKDRERVSQARAEVARTEADSFRTRKKKVDLIHKETRRATREQSAQCRSASSKNPQSPCALNADPEKTMPNPNPAAAAAPGAASLPQILEMLKESIGTLVAQEESVLSRESTSAAPDPASSGAASHLHILRKLTHSISEIARPQEPLLTTESTSAPTPGAASHLQLLHKFAESIANIAAQEDPKLPPDRKIFPPPAFHVPPKASSEETEDAELIRQAQIDFIKYEEELARQREAKQIYPEIPVEPRVRRPKPEAFHDPLSTSQTAPQTESEVPDEVIAQTTPQTENEVPDEVIIAFVEEMEKAHQYFKFRDYLRAQGVIEIKHYSNPEDILCKFRRLQTQEMKEFSLLDSSEIWLLIKAYIVELKFDDRILKGLKVMMPVNDADAHRNPVFCMLSQARQKSYVLDENLRVELKKLKLRTSLFYQDSLISRKPTVEKEARTVDVSNITDDASEKDIWSFFCTCGPIEDFDCHRSSSGQTAWITFKDASAVEFALKYTNTSLPHKIRSKELPLLIQARYVQDASGPELVVKNAVDVKSMLDEALDKYRELWTLYSQIQVDNNEEEEEECSDACEWMRLEALANGGNTSGEQNLLHSSEALEHPAFVEPPSPSSL